jgi:hypothetical protein
MFEGIVVWLNGSAETPFTHALDWARRLRLPLRGVLHSKARAGIDEAELVARCVRAGVDWDLSICQGLTAANLPEFFAPRCLCVFQRGRYDACEELAQWCLRQTRTASLVCPDRWIAAERVLLLNRRGPPGQAFLDQAARLCRAVGISPVVLTWAESVKEAQQRQQFAKQVLAPFPITEFDLLTGCSMPAAVDLVARCRRCTHVVLEQEPPASWWRFGQRNVWERLTASDSFCYLFLPASEHLNGPDKLHTSEPGTLVPGGASLIRDR